MAIPFAEIPSNLLVPLFYAEVKPAQTPYNASLRMMLIGHKKSSADAVYETPYILSGDDAARLFGKGSMLEAMYRKARAQSPFIEIWGCATTPAVGAVKATGSIQVTGNPANKSGLVHLWIAGYTVHTVIRPTDTAATLAARIKTNIDRNDNLPVRASINGTTDSLIDLECKWAGASGNSIWMEKWVWGSDNRYSSLLTLTQMANGSGNSGLAASLAAIGDEQFDVLIVGNQGSTSQLDELDDFFDHSSGRWSPYKQTFGHAFIGAWKSYANLITLGGERNGPHVTVMGTYGSPTPVWEWSAAIGARVTQHWATPPELSRPLQTIKLNLIEPPRNPADWWTIEERQALLDAGIATYTVDPDRTVRIDRLVTTYQTNDWGSPDASWRDAITLFQAMFFVRYMRAAITGAYPRAALTDEESGIEGFASPPEIKEHLIHAYMELQALGLVENVEDFSEALVVERNALDANRVDVLARPDFVNQLRIFAMLAETHLQLDLQDVAA